MGETETKGAAGTVGIDYRGVDRLGRDWRTGESFLRNLPNINDDVVAEVVRLLGGDAKTIHDDTCALIRLDEPSITGSLHQAKHAIRYRVSGLLMIEAELIPDAPEEASKVAATA